MYITTNIMSYIESITLALSSCNRNYDSSCMHKEVIQIKSPWRVFIPIHSVPTCYMFRLDPSGVNRTGESPPIDLFITFALPGRN